ncbi:MAG: RecX family transcriptional regulator [Gammaproteobacteria bacterium]|nr:RecX family transcriptional regulator [Gammaproteobacteria bacterium]|tara:strand:+ start:1750 stop:2268 length:519 start_codon:yes stop_codon:yes gene_type:complete
MGAELQLGDGQAYAQVRNAAIRLLAAREHAELELKRKLTTKGHPRDLVLGVITDLQAQDLQSDRRFAEGYVRWRESKGYGPMHIRQGLSARGIDYEIVDEHLTRSADHWLELAQHTLAKRFGSLEAQISGAQDDQDSPDRRNQLRKQWNKRARFLARRGFPSDIIYRALRQF